MSGPVITFNPNDDDGRVIYLTHNGYVARWSLMQAQAAHTRLGRVIADAERRMVHGPQMNDHQRRHLHALLGELDAKGDDRFPVLSEVLGREITSTNEMSPLEADQAIEALRARVRARRRAERELALAQGEQEPF